MADEEQWSMCEDGCLNVHTDPKAIIYHPNLNVILLVSNSHEVFVIDVNTGAILHRSCYTGSSTSCLQGAYLSGHDKLLLTDGCNVGLRSDYSGVLLLDSILQPPVIQTQQKVRVELPLSEALILHKALTQMSELPGADQFIHEVTQQLSSQFHQSQNQQLPSSKAAKWRFISLEMPAGSLWLVCSGLAQELKRQGRQVPAMTVASALCERLSTLAHQEAFSLLGTSEGSSTPYRALMFSEAARRATFSKWPHMNYKWALPEQMAQAGFYHQPNKMGDDRALCFTCNVCLVCWEPTDEPWSEHERHSPSCPFVKGEPTQNVPLSISYATQPAVKVSSSSASLPVEHVGPSSARDLIATSSKQGQITIWNVARKLKEEASFSVNAKHEVIQEAVRYKLATSTPKLKEAWTEKSELCDQENIVSSEATSIEAEVTALCIAALEREKLSKSSSCLVVGALMHHGEGTSSSMVQAMNYANQASSFEEEGKEDACAYLLVYDLHYSEQKQSDNNKNNKDAKKNKSSRQDLYTDSTFLNHILYENFGVPVIEDSSADADSIEDPVELHPPPNTSAVKFVSDNCLPSIQRPMDIPDETLEPVLLQCIELPEKVRKSMVVTSVQPTRDGNHLLVTLGVPQAKEAVASADYQGVEECQLINSIQNSIHSMLGGEADKNTWAAIVGKGGSIVFDTSQTIAYKHIDFESDDKSNHFGEILLGKDVKKLEEMPKAQEQPDTAVEQQPFGAVLLYALDGTDRVVVEQPLLWRFLSSSSMQTLLLPCSEKEGDGDLKSKEPQGLAAIVCRDGAVRVLDIASLSTVATAKPSQMNAKFVSATYCNSLEQLCLCSDAGKLHFFTLAVPGAEPIEEESDQILYLNSSKVDAVDSAMPGTSSAVDLLAYQPTTLSSLRTMQQLTKCVNLTPCFTANAPACWSEMMQAQKQRRHPQHLQQGGEELHHTRTWRLQHENSTWDEHVFELTLPRSCCVGHVDVKFSLHSLPSMATEIQVTLLKLNSSGIGKKDKPGSRAVDDGINFKFSGNPVTSEEYSSEHNTEVLCGPVNMMSSLDLSGLSGIVTLTSPALLVTRSRTLLIHIKAIFAPSDKSMSSKKDDRAALKRGRTELKGIKEQLLNADQKIDLSYTQAPPRPSSSSQSKKEMKGCDYLHEISITIRRSCRTSIPNERSQRKGMVESLSFIERLIGAACLQGPENNSMTQSIALDILIWICSVKLARYRGPQIDHQASQVELVQLIEKNMESLVLNCLLLSNRSLAHKFAKLCVICSEGLKNAMDSPSPTFDNTLLNALLNALPMVPRAQSSGALHWFFMMLSRKALLNPTTTGQKCMTLLQQVATELSSRSSPEHMLLRTRFGLYGLPLEPQIFDAELPLQQCKSSSIPLSYATIVSGEASMNTYQNMAPSNGFSELKNMFTGTNIGASMISENQMRGLLETQPLHFTCHAASDGTKLEALPSSDGMYMNSVWESEGFSFSDMHQSDEENSIGNLAMLPWQQLLSPPTQQTLVIERMHSGARRFVVLDFGATVALTDLFIPACPDLVSLSIDYWVSAEETDGQRLVVASDIGTKSLTLSDLQPQPLCRYLKVTTIGRYGMSTARCRIPVGQFYGHMVLVPLENCDESVKNDDQLHKHYQAILQALIEDAQCRHSLASAKLKGLLAPYLQVEQSSISHLYNFLRPTVANSMEHLDEQKIINAYQECIAFQRQLSIVRHVLSRLRSAASMEPRYLDSKAQQVLSEACTDKLRIMSDCLLDTLLGIAHESGSNRGLALQLNQKSCLDLFQPLCVGTESHTQLAACSLLVRGCGLQPWWGDFLADSLVQLFGSGPLASIFPLDRVFMLLTYLGRKSLLSSPKSSVLESVLLALGKLLKPIHEAKGYKKAQLDLSLIGWLLLYLSSCLDVCLPEDKSDQGASSAGANPGGSNRWTFIQGYEAMQKHLASWNKSSSSRCYSRKLQKRLMHHSQQLKELEAAKKAYQSSTQALSALSTQAATLSSKLEAALKAQEQFLKKTVQQHTLKQRWREMSQAWRMERGSSEAGSSLGGAGCSRISEDPTESYPYIGLLPQALSLPVARGLVSLILNMDFTCNSDLFLLACKVLSGIISCARPSITLNMLMTDDELLQFVQLAVKCEGGSRSLWGGPWVSHAISCLLQDLLEARPSGLEMKSRDASPSDDSLEAPQSEATMEGESQDDSVVTGSSAEPTKPLDNMKMPSLLESEDSELDDTLEDIWIRGKYLLSRKGSTQRTVPSMSSTTAMDARLEFGFEWNSEVILRRLSTQNTHNLSASILSSLQQTKHIQTAGSWDNSLVPMCPDNISLGGSSNSETMMSSCFERIFCDLQLQPQSVSLEQTLQLWHTLAQQSPTFDSTAIPILQLNRPAVVGLMSALVWSPNVSLCTWALAFQCLTLTSNQPKTDDWKVSYVIEDPNFIRMLRRFLSGDGAVDHAGSMVCQNLNQLLVRLLTLSEIEDFSSSSTMKEEMLKLLLELVSPHGAIELKHGPLDAQCTLLEFLLKLNYETVNLAMLKNLCESVSRLVYWTFQNTQNVECRKSSHDSPNANSASRCFGSLFSSVLGTEPPVNKRANKNALECNLLTLTTKLILSTTGCKHDSANRDGLSSKSDEEKESSKVESPVKATSQIDSILEDEASIMRLMTALANCNINTMALAFAPNIDLSLLTMPDSLVNMGNDASSESAGDAVLNLLITLAKNTSKPELIMKPLLNYMKSSFSGAVLQLSEALLWFILKLVSVEKCLGLFIKMGGIKIVCQNLVRSCSSVINTQPSLVSMVMQHLYRNTPVAPSKKGATQLESVNGMLNFAPLGVISSSNLTTQPADSLLQASPPHRRARTPAWSYHFYPDEHWVDLTINLPCSVLLKEIQMLPHLTSLATCPSAVAIEIAREPGSAFFPVCSPINTSCLTFVSLRLPVPEVAGSVLIRLYKPKDSSNIGLSQIRLLGSTSFGDNFTVTKGNVMTTNNDQKDEETLTKTSFGWLRLLYFTMVMSPPSSPMLKEVVAAAAESEEELLDACCALLFVPPPASLSPSLERVLLYLGLHNSELGLKEINLLLHHTRASEMQGFLTEGDSSHQSVVELLAHLCLTQDSSTHLRVAALLTWLKDIAESNIKQSSSENCDKCYPSGVYIHASAAILWASKEKEVSYDLPALITGELPSILYEWSAKLPESGALKRAVDCVICSLCYISPQIFSDLLTKIGIESLESRNVTRDTILTEGQLLTIAMACQSPMAVDRFLNSKLPIFLTKCILDWCHGNQAEKASRKNQKLFCSHGVLSTEGVAVVLKFFADICCEGKIRDWLGSPEGSEFWLPLLLKLCNERQPESSKLSEAHANVQSATVMFLSQCTTFHPENQHLLCSVLCEVIRRQQSSSQNLKFLHGLSGFTRRLILQLLLESEKILVSIKADCTLNQCPVNATRQASRHPRHGTGHQNQLLMLRSQSTCADILKLMTIPASVVPSSDPKAEASQDLKVSYCDPNMSYPDQMSVAAGVTAQDKRAKDARNASSAAASSQASVLAGSAMLAANCYCLHHRAWPNQTLPVHLTMSNLLAALRLSGHSLSSPGLTLTLNYLNTDAEKMDFAAPYQTISTPLQVFAQMGGLALLAKHLPLVYPQALKIQPPEVAKNPSPDPVDADWVKVEVSEDFLDSYSLNEFSQDLEEPLPISTSAPKTGNVHPLVTPSVPPHSLVAFGLFLRLPGYAEVLLRDRKKAQCLLRLVLGVSDDGEGGEIFNSSVAPSLPTLPFQVLRELFDSTPLNSDDGLLLRAATLEHGAIHLLLNCLAHFTHHTGTKSPVQSESSKPSNGADRRSKKAPDDKSHLYWAKGTGFGTGSTQQSWNVEQALQRQKGEEEYVTVLLQVLASFINPLGAVPAHFYSEDESSSEGETESKERSPLPASFPMLLSQSCLLPAVSSYLRNDSVLDMARHIPLYTAVLQLLRAMAFSPQLANLLLPSPTSSGRMEDLSVVCLLTKMKSCVDTYASRLKGVKPKKASKTRKHAFANLKQQEDETDQQDEEGLAQLIPDIQETANLVQLATERLVIEDDFGSGSQSDIGSMEKPLQVSLEEKYLEIMRRLRFDSFEMITENEEANGFRFVVAYHFEPNMRAAGDRSLPSRVKRLAQETVTLSTSLPLSYSSSVFVRCDTDRMDIMKVLITGPAETPYANGCFEFDVFFPPDYPSSPMLINLQTTGHQTVRFNPNLYNDGKVCLSVLNTWHGRPEEKWNAHTSSFLQVLVSIQSLILVPEPYFNEPGYERSRGTPSGTHSSREYNSNIYQATVRWAMLEQLRQPSPCFKEVVHNHFWFKRHEIEQQIDGWIKELDSQSSDRRTGRAISVNSVSLKRHYRQLKEELANLKAPAGLEDLALAMEQQHQQQAISCSPSTSKESTMEPLPGEPTTPSTPTPSNPPTPTGEQSLMPNSVYDPELVQHV
ncbi:baculoviral IAP repeat-containing protein 6 [Neocloeon triangulifer]|uniref:baculoviral IAP repeat-containing protein 6 n=1 Tax=Neocloeon triangulifer TaxID=2078957 RepID=UPI00286F008B|nr:baculoviral IAP repeat-containing protein 6 [Neocloeon triangulifer]